MDCSLVGKHKFRISINIFSSTRQIFRHESKPKGKNRKMEAESGGPPFWRKYSPVTKSSLLKGGNIFIHKYSCVFFYWRLSLIFLEFSHLICLNHKNPVNLPNKRATMALNRSPESVSPQNEFYLLYYYCFNLWPPGWGQFWPQECHMNRIDIGPNIIVQGQMIKALLLLVSEKKNFKVFLLCSYVSNLWPLGRGPIWPRGIIWTTLVEVL